MELHDDISYKTQDAKKHTPNTANKPLPEFVRGLANFLGLRTAEEPTYLIKEKELDKEIRHYPDLSLAHINVQGDYETASEVGFHYLTNFIFGKNTRQAKMEMMVPFFQQRTTSGWMLSFVLPNKYSAETAPAPLDARITLDHQPAHDVAVITYSGWTNKKIIYAKTRELIKWIKAKDEYHVISKPRAAQYDPPFAIPFLRRNEIHLTVSPRRAMNGPSLH